MSSDAQTDTRSPWLEVFAQQSQAGQAQPTEDKAEAAARSGSAEPERPTQELFDCYNA